jgi:hypothetical protein
MAMSTFRSAVQQIERGHIDVILLVDLKPPRVRPALVIRSQVRDVIYIVAEDRVTIPAVPPRVEYVLVPELVHILIRRGDDIVLALAGQRVKEPFVATLNALRLFNAPAFLLDQAGADGTQVQLVDMPLRE